MLAIYESGRFPRLRGLSNVAPWIAVLAGLGAVRLAGRDPARGELAQWRVPERIDCRFGFVDAAEELRAVHDAYLAGTGLTEALRRATVAAAAPEAGRLYTLLGNAHDTGGRLAEALVDLATDLRAGLERDKAATAVNVIVHTSFSFPSAGTLMVLAFVPFAAWATDQPLTLAQLGSLSLAGPRRTKTRSSP